MRAMNDTRRMRTLVAVAAVAVLSGTVHAAPSDAPTGAESRALTSAQSGIRPSYDSCLQAANTTADMVACSNEEYAYQDKRLNDAYKRLMSALPAAKQASLRAEERKWVTFKTKHCKPPAGSGTLAIVESSQCAVDETAKRARELEGRKPSR